MWIFCFLLFIYSFQFRSVFSDEAVTYVFTSQSVHCIHSRERNIYPCDLELLRMTLTFECHPQIVSSLTTMPNILVKFHLGQQYLSQSQHTARHTDRTERSTRTTTMLDNRHAWFLTCVWVSPSDAANSALSGRPRYWVRWNRLVSCCSCRLV